MRIKENGRGVASDREPPPRAAQQEPVSTRHGSRWRFTQARARTGGHIQGVRVQLKAIKNKALLPPQEAPGPLGSSRDFYPRHLSAGACQHVAHTPPATTKLLENVSEMPSLSCQLVLIINKVEKKIKEKKGKNPHAFRQAAVQGEGLKAFFKAHHKSQQTRPYLKQGTAQH